MPEADLIVVGAGVAGLAHAWAAARRGLRVAVLERSPQARGASVRNFGLIWPIGQAGETHALAMRSRELWIELLEGAHLPYFANGSLHLAYRQDERDVAEEFAELGPLLGYPCRWIGAHEAMRQSNAVEPEGLLGALASESELTVDPRLVIGALPRYLAERYEVAFRFGCAVRAISLPAVETAAGRWTAQRAIVCSGEDFETLYPDVFAQSGIIRTKLQMMRTWPQPDGWSLGPALAAGLTLRFYPSFRRCASLAALRRRIAAELPEYDRWGIHVMASQTPAREVTIGDSHEYGLDVDPFDKPRIDRLILEYLRTFVRLPNPDIAERWHGVYAKHPTEPYVLAEPAAGVKVVAALGGAGMTLSFGLAERNLLAWT